MSSTWSRKRRNVPIQTIGSSNFTSASHTKTLPLPTYLHHQQVLLSRSSEKMLEESELSGVLNLAGRKMKEFPSTMAGKYDMSDLVSIDQTFVEAKAILIRHIYEHALENEGKIAGTFMLDLSDNRLTEIPKCICESRSLESVRVRGNALRSIPSNIVFLHSLTVLDLSNNKIVHLPSGLFELPLEIILLTGNRLESIPHEIRQLSATLSELDVSCNFLKTIPADIALLKMLRVLNLRRNLLEQFPSEICCLSLHTLDLSSNRFVHLPLHIRKMKSLVVLRLGNNPLRSPPASLVTKGREYVFKWMDVESNGVGHVTSLEGAQTGQNISVIKSSYRFRGVGMDSVYEIQQCCSTSNDSRHRILRFGNVRVSDPGYPNAADDHRLSRELAPNSGLVEISEHAASLRSVEKENQCCETLNKSPSGNSCYKTNKSFMNMSGAVLHSNEEMESVEAPLNEPPSLHISKGSNVVTDNGNEDQHNNIERLTPLDLSNNNSSLIGDAYSVTDVRSVVAGIASVPSKPISKVAPLISVRSKSPLPTVQNSTSKAVQSKICPPSNADSMRRFCRDTSSRGNKNIAHTNAVASKVLTSPPTINNTPLKKSRLSSQSVRPSNIVAGVPKMATRMVDGQHQNVFAKSTISKRDKNAASSPCRILASSKFREVDNAAVDVIRKIFSDRLQIVLPDDIDALVGELADGVHLCNLVNSIRPRFITSIYSSHGAVLTPSKAKRNVDNFVSSCRKLGISEVSICSSSDILNKKNIASVAKTVIALQKFLQKECGSSTSACSSGMDKRRIFHV